MKKHFGHITILVDDYDKALDFYVGKLGFVKIMDTAMGPDFRWVSVSPDKDAETKIVFVKAHTPDKKARMGSQAADHVFLVLETDNCLRDYETLKSKGVTFFGEPKKMPWGTEVVFEDLYGNHFDLLQIA
jgi:catechol 2,3-dioxygenase-like lactoylglutathione lyase family enzyme